MFEPQTLLTDCRAKGRPAQEMSTVAISHSMWESLPRELLASVFGFLQITERIHVSSVSHEWRNVLFHPLSWWTTSFEEFELEDHEFSAIGRFLAVAKPRIFKWLAIHKLTDKGMLILSGFTSLLELELTQDESDEFHGPPNHSVQLALASLPNLEVLKIHGLPQLSSVVVPSRSLRCLEIVDCRDLFSFACHMHQMTTLTVRGSEQLNHESTCQLASSPAPRLRHLELGELDRSTACDPTYGCRSTGHMPSRAFFSSCFN